MKLMKVAVGSTNPAKIRAVENAFKKTFKNGVVIVSLSVESKVPDQPSNDKETFRGALNRAKAALKEAKGDFGVGIEGGLHTHSHGVFSNAWIAVIDKKGRVGSGSSARFQIPKRVLSLIDSGMELGLAIDKLVGGHGTKKRGGAYSVLTNGKLSRAKAYEHGVMCALMPFITPKYW